ncbi:unnamed protein product [Aspergillus oryzae]|uniref:Unnamed protein product n=2 Tax=Aspergillus oryzae TaxID=5062 RepID=A0AAN4YVN5_ASPOZ|nr:unnamed protein product [Aspergillus oryzae]GMF95312.1 unnamed protein product [Aspergillus oryzae]GMG34182.1 unnamed protein product [Aspergillus oryzae]
MTTLMTTLGPQQPLFPNPIASRPYLPQKQLIRLCPEFKMREIVNDLDQELAKQSELLDDQFPLVCLPLTKENLTLLNMSTESNTMPPPRSVSSLSRSSSSQRLSDSTYRKRVLSRAGIKVDANLPMEVQNQINIILQTPPVDTSTLESLALKLQSDSNELIATQAGEEEWTSLLQDIVKALKSTTIHCARSRGTSYQWIPCLGADISESSQSNIISGDIEDPSTHGTDLDRPAKSLSITSGKSLINPISLENPRPNISVGLSDIALAENLQSRQVNDAKYLLIDLQDNRQLISDPGVTPLNLHFPFLVFEVKSASTGGNLYQAQNQSAVGGASAIEILRALYKLCEGHIPNTSARNAPSTACQFLTFSVTTEGPVCELWVHFWNELDESYCMGNIDIWRFTHKSKASNFISNLSSILNWGSTTFRDRVVQQLILFYEAEMSIIQTLISFYIIPEMGTIQVPQTLPRQISDGYNCKKSEIESIVMSSCHSIDESPEANIVRDLRSESAEDFQTRKISLFRRHRAAAIDEFTNTIMNMWPSRAPAMTRYDGLVAVSQYADVQKALIFASALFESWYGNKCFFEYLTEIETMLGRLKETQTLLGMTCQDIGPTGSWQPWRVKHAQPILRRGLISIDDIFASLAPFHVPFSGTDLTDF